MLASSRLPAKAAAQASAQPSSCVAVQPVSRRACFTAMHRCRSACPQPPTCCISCWHSPRRSRATLSPLPLHGGSPVLLIAMQSSLLRAAKLRTQTCPPGSRQNLSAWSSRVDRPQPMLMWVPSQHLDGHALSEGKARQGKAIQTHDCLPGFPSSSNTPILSC